LTLTDFNGVVIRRASPADADEIAAFAFNAFQDAYRGQMNEADISAYVKKSFDREVIAGQLKADQTLFHIALTDNEMQGYTKLRWDRSRPELSLLKAMEMERIYVHVTHYRSGLGSILFNHALKVSADLGFECMWLAVWQKYERAVSFYKKMGMEIFGVQEFTVNTIVNHDYVLKIKI
jgi:diamine N-acetyltransferase